MIINIIVILLVLGIGYAWMIRGMFSSLIHFLCAVAAGAVAFGVWEQLAIVLIEASPEKGFLSSVEGVAWGVGLIAPFVVTFVLLRLITDKLVSNNISNSTVVDYVGGGICGLGTGILASGILVLGVGTMRLSTDFMGYQPLWYSTDRSLGDGALVRSDQLWIPVDKMTAFAYSKLSVGTMSTGEPLSKWYPELEIVGFSTRVSPGKGGGRNAISPDDFKIKSTYTVGDVDGSGDIRDLLKDSLNTKAQKYLDINSESISKGYIAGYVVEFEPGAKERGKTGGQIYLSNGQFRLLVENEDGDTTTVFPIAVISESSTAGIFGRWRFDSPDLFITTVGGTSRNTIGFEFVIPQGFQPLGFFAKNIRVNKDELPKAVEFTSITQRDILIITGEILKGTASTTNVDTTNTLTFDSTDDSNSRILAQSSRLGQMMSITNAKRGFTVNDKNELLDGERAYKIETVGRANSPTGKKLRADRFGVSSGQTIISVDIGPDSPIGLFSDPFSDASLDEPLVLVDDAGNEYEAVGFEYTDSKQYHIRLTRGSTLTGITDTPSLSRSRSDQKLRLIFIVTAKSTITQFKVGDIAIADFAPPFVTR